MTTNFVHLNVHSEYSIVDGIVRIKPLVQACADDQMGAVAITDVANLFATVKFYSAATKAGIKPIFGSQIWLHNDDDPSQPYSLILLCQNKQGYLNLSKLISRAYIEGQAHGKAQVQTTWLTELNSDLIALSGAMEGDIGHAIVAGQMDKAEQLLQDWRACFPERFYLELQRTGKRNEATYIRGAVQLAKQTQTPVVATNGVCFLSEDDFDAHEARVCIHDGFVLGDGRRPKRHTPQQYFRTADEMQKLFADIPSAISNTVEIAKRCNYKLDLGTYYLPNFPIPAGMTIEEYIIAESEKGLEERLAILFDKSAPEYAETRKPYDERLAIELKVINDMGFPGYFLIVADFIQWAKHNGVPVGPGRGSGAGSLVAYALQITDLDPLKYELLFERFLNPERVSMPDFDVDFCMEGRDRVIEYVAETYGRESVSQIITYGTMAAKAVVRDVGRVLGHPYGFVDKISKLIPFELGITLDKALSQEDDLRERYEHEDEVRELIDLAKKLEGITRNAGKHAGGVVIAPSELTNFSPIYCEDNGSGYVTQFDKDDVETIGLVKFDFLGLRTLTIIDWAVQAVNKRLMRTEQTPVDISLIPVDDEATFELLKSCATTAIFQLESRGMKDLIHRLQPDCFEDIVALVALFRPGPLQSGMVDDFIDRKHGRAKVEFPHPALETILKPTYGVILYQEQVMQIAQVLAGYTLGGADILRRAMGKKKPEEMAKQRKIFTEGAIKNGVEEETATYIFDLMEKFAGYGFNKSHSAAYALVSYQTAWLKTHYPAEFMAAVCSSDMDNTDKVVTFIDECRDMGLTVLAPDINQGDYKFVVNDKGEIIYGLGAIKGVGEAVLDIIVDERTSNGPYTDLFNFTQRLDLKKANKRVLEALVRSGALDCFGEERATVFMSLEKAVQMADKHAKDQASGQHDLFGMSEASDDATPEYVNAKPWRERVRLQGEKETLGLYFSGHPIERYQDELKAFTTSTIANLKPSYAQSVVIAGFVVGMRTMMTKRGDRMAFVTLDDRSGRIDMAVFSDLYAECRELLSSDELLVVEGEVSIDDYTGGFRMSCRRLMDIEQARRVYAKHILLKLTPDTADTFSTQVKSILSRHGNGACPVCLDYQRPDSEGRIQLGDQWRVNPSDELLDELREVMGREQVVLDY
ncbi:MAG: DNA polymerase III subunit alpha [Legionellales bacterium]|nr:DNA polymerase III subunit alpha [Legionellales bacterium]|tara:strand:+ start:4052 stop:7507 length:3456 start_codon:yes stop_codon:yes gene_type:complete